MDDSIAGKHHVKDPERKCSKNEKRSQGNKNGKSPFCVVPYIDGLH